MRIEEMNAEQRETLQVFNDALERAGWEVENFEEMLAAGISVHPEGMAARTGEKATLEVHLCLPEREFRLFIRKRETDQLVRLVLEFKADLQAILHCLISEQDRLDTSTFPQFLHRTHKMAEQIWFVDHEGTRFPLEFPTSG